MEMVGNAEAKTNLKSPFYVWKIDSRYLKDHRSSFKKDKKNTKREHRNEASKKKAKFQTPSLTNQTLTQDFKKRDGGQQENG